jgi:hypothetical protein
VAAGAAVLGSLAAAGPATAGTVSQTFDQPGEDYFIVPEGVSAITVHAIGEHGGSVTRGDGSLVGGGWGGDVTGKVAVFPGATYWVQVGWGASRGGAGTYPGGNGGGASSFSTCSLETFDCEGYGSVPELSRLIVAGGGGGAAGGYAGNFGRGGNAGLAGFQSEQAQYDPVFSTGGDPGGESWAGAGGDGRFEAGSAGSLAYGGWAGGGATAYAGGGGGGAGWYGGGGGGGSSYEVPIGGGGGGGGSNHYDATAREVHVKTATTILPQVELSWRDDAAPAVSIDAPAHDGLTVEAQPTLTGTAGTAEGDRSVVDVAVYAGSSATGAEPVQTHPLTPAGGRWSVQLSRLAPGTYTVVATQRDWADNVGSRTLTFHVGDLTPAPTPKPQPSPAPQTPAAPAPAAQPRPAVVRIATTHARVIRSTLSLRLRCTGPSGQRCRGRLTLRAVIGKRAVPVAFAPYTIAAGQAKTVRLRLHASTLPRRVTAMAAGTSRTIAIR